METEVLDPDGVSTTTLSAEGEIVTGGHNISEKDFYFMKSEAKQQFNCLSGRLMQAIEMMGLNDKQERAIKTHVKAQIYERFRDFIESMSTLSRTQYCSNEPIILDYPEYLD